MANMDDLRVGDVVYYVGGLTGLVLYVDDLLAGDGNNVEVREFTSSADVENGRDSCFGFKVDALLLTVICHVEPATNDERSGKAFLPSYLEKVLPDASRAVREFQNARS